MSWSQLAADTARVYRPSADIAIDPCSKAARPSGTYLTSPLTVQYQLSSVSSSLGFGNRFILIMHIEALLNEDFDLSFAKKKKGLCRAEGLLIAIPCLIQVTFRCLTQLCCLQDNT